MKTVVITGSARGFGLEMAKEFKKYNWNIILSDLYELDLKNAIKNVEKVKSLSKCINVPCDVTKESDISNLIKTSTKEFGTIDIWINNAGINQVNKPIWELNGKEIDELIDVDLKGTITCSRLIFNEMNKHNKGAIYNVEGYGSNDAFIVGLSIYGTCKRGITYFTDALAHEAKCKNSSIVIGKLSPGIMITDFITTAYRDKKMELPDKTKRIYNILGDYPNEIAGDLVFRMITNTKSGVRLKWLTKPKVIKRFVCNAFKKRNIL